MDGLQVRHSCSAVQDELQDIRRHREATDEVDDQAEDPGTGTT